MKTSIKIFTCFFAIAIFAACATGESEILKQARTVQEGLLKQVHNLDSTMDRSIAECNKKIENLSMDSVAMKDSANLVIFQEYQTKSSSLTEYKSKLADWKAGAKFLPTAEEIKKGAENPFGKEAKDQDILDAIKKSQEEFGTLQSEIETIMQ
jgi:hypothetical protein